MRFSNLTLSLFMLFLFGCGPSPEEIKKSSNEYFEKAVSISDSEPCLKLDAFEEMIKFNKENKVNHNILKARQLMKPLETECAYEQTRARSFQQEEDKQKLKSVIFKCSSPKLFDSNAYANEATYAITGNWISHDPSQGRSAVFGEPSGNFSNYVNYDIYLKLSKNEDANNYENYDSYVLNEHGDIYLTSGDLGENIDTYSLYLRNKNNLTSFDLSRDNFKLISGTQYETLNFNHRIVGSYNVNWTFKYSSSCRTISLENLHSHLFSITDNIKSTKIEIERMKKERSEREEALRIKNQKEKNKI